MTCMCADTAHTCINTHTILGNMYAYITHTQVALVADIGTGFAARGRSRSGGAVPI
jgi:hypothetical protein